jgi:hypothetical protein
MAEARARVRPAAPRTSATDWQDFSVAQRGRPGSWEAERVRQTLQSTVGVDDEYLLQHRTEPLVIDLWVDSILRNTNDTTYDDYRDAEMELLRREEAIPQPDDLPPRPVLPRRPAHRRGGLDQGR